MCIWSVREQHCHVRSFYYSFQNNTMPYCTLLLCYIALLAWHPRRSLGQKLWHVKPSQTMLLWHLLLCLFYMHISVSNVTLSMQCYCTRACVITFLPVFLWRVTINARRKEKLELSHRKTIYARRKEMHWEIFQCNGREKKVPGTFLIPTRVFKSEWKKSSTNLSYPH